MDSINKKDPSNMRQVILDSPKQLTEGLALAANATQKGSLKEVLVCGIGGSALPVEILQPLLLPISLHRDYGLPQGTTKETLVICISYSGNTEETLSSLQAAIDQQLPVICIASGGKIEELCKEHGIPFVKVPSGIQPRSATGYIFSAFVKVLENTGFVQGMFAEIMETAEKLAKANDSLEKEGRVLAKRLEKHIPVVYASNQWQALARIWKIKFNENAKSPAFFNVFPELNHNEMVGYSNIKNLGFKDFYVIMLQDSQDHPRVLKRMELTNALLKQNGVETEIVAIQEGSFSFKTFSTLLLGDWISYYLALAYGIDPTPVAMVEEFKKLMQRP